MGAARLKAKTTIIQHDEQDLSIRSIEVLPELLQVREKLDKGWSLQYSKDYAKGDAFPPVLVYRLPDGTIVLVDGFHRVDACLAIGLKTIRCQIREGAMQEALLAAIEANTAAFHRGRPFGEDDRRHAAELMIRNPEFYDWSDQRIGDICGASNKVVQGVRLQLLRTDLIPLPERVKTKDGRSKVYSYTPQGIPSGLRLEVRKQGRPRYSMRYNGKTIHLGTDEDEAKAKYQEICSNVNQKAQNFDCEGLRSYLIARGILPERLGLSPSQYRGLRGFVSPGIVFTAIKSPGADSIPWVLGCLLMMRRASGDDAARMVCVVDKDSKQIIALKTVDLASEFGVDFLTPEELAASLSQS